MSGSFTHIDKKGNPQMVDVSSKSITERKAIARSVVWLGPEVASHLIDGEIVTRKGPVFHTAIIAGTMASKKTSELIPFCHPVGLDNCSISIDHQGEEVIITCTTVVNAKTGVEMEAIVGASVTALTIYDMCKGISHNIIIRETRLVEKTGGKSDFRIKE
jgi:cyclic pyranopterin phosphate synthase